MASEVLLFESNNSNWLIISRSGLNHCLTHYSVEYRSQCLLKINRNRIIAQIPNHLIYCSIYRSISR